MESRTLLPDRIFKQSFSLTSFHNIYQNNSKQKVILVGGGGEHITSLISHHPLSSQNPRVLNFCSVEYLNVLSLSPFETSSLPHFLHTTRAHQYTQAEIDLESIVMCQQPWLFLRLCQILYNYERHRLYLQVQNDIFP